MKISPLKLTIVVLVDSVDEENPTLLNNSVIPVNTAMDHLPLNLHTEGPRQVSFYMYVKALTNIDCVNQSFHVKVRHTLILRAYILIMVL
jgi:hypothetical protein